MYGSKSLRSMRFVHCPEVRGSLYLGGRNVLTVCYDWLGVGGLSVLQKLSTSWSVCYQVIHNGMISDQMCNYITFIIIIIVSNTKV